MITQDDIAKELNLSKSTVSRILSGKSFFEDETRARVLALASKMGYRHLRPTVRRHIPQSRKVLLIGAIIEEADGPNSAPLIPAVATRTLRGISEAARMEEVAIHVDYFTQSETAQLHLPEHQPALLRKGRLSGLLLLGGMNLTAIRKLSDQLPCVRVNNREPEVSLDCVGQNDLDATEALARHLFALGHRQIGFLTQNENNWPYHARLAGFGLALTRLGLGQHPESVVTLQPSGASAGGWNWAAGQEALLKQIRKGVRAWICAHDDLGYRLIQFLQQQKIRVPEEVAVCGFDNLDIPDRNLPRLTTIEWPFEDIGAAAMRRLLRRILEPASAQVYMMFNGRLTAGPSTTSPGVIAERETAKSHTSGTSPASSIPASKTKAGTSKGSDSRNSN